MKKRPRLNLIQIPFAVTKKMRKNLYFWTFLSQICENVCFRQPASQDHFTDRHQTIQRCWPPRGVECLRLSDQSNTPLLWQPRKTCCFLVIFRLLKVLAPFFSKQKSISKIWLEKSCVCQSSRENIHQQRSVLKPLGQVAFGVEQGCRVFAENDKLLTLAPKLLSIELWCQDIKCRAPLGLPPCKISLPSYQPLPWQRAQNPSFSAYFHDIGHFPAKFFKTGDIQRNDLFTMTCALKYPFDCAYLQRPTSNT